MKKLLYLILVFILFTSCDKSYNKIYIPGEDSGIVVDYWESRVYEMPERDFIKKTYTVQIRSFSGGLKEIEIARHEYYLIELGDTITNIDPKYKQYKTR